MRAKSKSNQLQTNNNNNANNKGKLIENNNNSLYYYYCSETGKTDNRHKRSREQQSTEYAMEEQTKWRRSLSERRCQVLCFILCDCVRVCFWQQVCALVCVIACAGVCVCNLHRQMQVKHKSCYGLAWKYATLRRLPQGKGGGASLCVCVCV